MNDQIQDFFEKSLVENHIDNELYQTYSVKKGLRNEDGTGVLVGLTKISDVVGYKIQDGEKTDDYGSLYYRGINVEDIINCLLYTSPSPRDRQKSRMPSSA